MTSAKILSVIQKYHDQLSRTKRAVVFKKAMRLLQPPEDRVTLSQEGRRKELIHKLSREIINNLMVSKEPTGIALEIKESLEEKLGQRLFFEFDPKEKSIIVRREDKSRLAKEEQEEVLQTLRSLTEEKLRKIIS